MKFQTDYPATARVRSTASESGSQIIDRPPESLGNGVDVSLMMSMAFAFLAISQPPESLQLTALILILQFLATVPAGSRWRWCWRWQPGRAWAATGSTPLTASESVAEA